MKASERYTAAMVAVINNTNINAADKLEIIETLMGDKSIAEFREKQEAEKNGESL